MSEWGDIGEQIVVIATVLGSIAALPALIEFWIETRKRRYRTDLSLEDEPVSALTPRVAGLDAVIQESADLIDRVRAPDYYRELNVGNELLIVGPPLFGKKSLAQKIAKEAQMDRLITVYNARNEDALVHAKDLIRSAGSQKVMLLLPRIDLVFAEDDQEILTELDALIETSSEKSNVLVVGTAVNFEPDSDLDNSFGTKLVLGASVAQAELCSVPPETKRVLSEVFDFYLREAAGRGFVLQGVSSEEIKVRILGYVTNPAEIEDILVLAQTTALYHLRSSKTKGREITAEIIEKSIRRVIVSLRL